MSDKQKPGKTPTDAEALRKRAEQQAQTSVPTNLSAQTPEEIQRALHELRVHQIELEIQNEELCTAQAEIEAVRTRYYDLYDLAPVGYCTLSEQGLILEANLTATTLLGVTRSALRKQRFSSFILKEDQDIYYLHRKRLFESGEPQNCDLRMLKKDGTPFWASLSGNIAQTEDGAPVCRVILNDTTERKQAEEALRASQALFSNSFEYAAIGITLVTPEGQLFKVNPAFCEMLGYDKSELFEIHYADITHPDDVEKDRAYKESMHSGEIETYQKDKRYIKKSGQVVWVTISVSLVRDANNQPLYEITQVEDITDRKQAEEALHQKMDELIRFQRVTVGRELKMIELKKEINILLTKAGAPEKYRIEDAQ